MWKSSVVVLGSPSLISITLSLDSTGVKQHWISQHPSSLPHCAATEAAELFWAAAWAHMPPFDFVSSYFQVLSVACYSIVSCWHKWSMSLVTPACPQFSVVPAYSWRKFRRDSSVPIAAWLQSRRQCILRYVRSNFKPLCHKVTNASSMYTANPGYVIRN